MSLNPNRCADHPKRDSRTAIKIIALLSRKNVTQTALAQKCGVQAEAINRTIWGVRNGNRLRSAIARELGYETWEALKKAEVNL